MKDKRVIISQFQRRCDILQRPYGANNMKHSPEKRKKKKNRSIMVITGGILALICPTEYYKRHAEILKEKNDMKAVSTSFSVQNKAGPTSTTHNSIRNLKKMHRHYFCHSLYSINRPASVSILSSPPVSFFQALQIFISGFCPVSVLSGKSGARLAERRCEEGQLPSATRDFQQKHQCV